MVKSNLLVAVYKLRVELKSVLAATGAQSVMTTGHLRMLPLSVDN